MEADHGVHAWSPPIYDASKAPKLAFTTALEPDSGFSQNFARLAKWCPDGSTALAQCENASFQLLDLSPALVKYNAAYSQSTGARCFHQSAPIVDFAWYPSATHRDPASYCFVASVRESPVKLMDASDGRLRASYPIVDHRERQIAPHSLAFNVTADRLYCGFEDAIEVFDVNRPGEGTRLPTTPSKKSRDGLKGIISALAFSPDMSSGIYAAGSLSPSSPSSSNIALFTEATGEVPVMFVGDERGGIGYGIRASVTQLMFNPARPHELYASFRRHDSIYSWDIRGNVGMPVEIFQRHPVIPHVSSHSRAQSPTVPAESMLISVTEASTTGQKAADKAQTNQKLRFDIDLSGKWLGVGDQTGSITLFDLISDRHDTITTDAADDQITQGEALDVGPTLQFRGHKDAVGSVGFHPIHPLLLSVSGSRHFGRAERAAQDSSSSSSSDEDIGSTDEVEVADAVMVKRSRIPSRPYTLDSSVKLWDFDGNRSTSIGST